MLVRELTNPGSIAVIGGSNTLQKPGGKILKNLLDGSFPGQLYVVNPKEEEVQGVRSYRSVELLPDTDLAILAIAAAHCPDTVKYLAANKKTRGFIILSAGFAEESEEGARMEKEIAETVEKYKGSLIGPNCIGVINRQYRGVFTTPVPRLDPAGCDLISGSGATAVFIMEAGIPNGLTFSSVYSVGNSAQTGVEEVLAHLDETFDPETSSRVKLLYIENIDKPDVLLTHARSLIKKGCRIAAIKAGTSEAGSRAASSHTGALASPDSAVDALLRKAGIVRCYSRLELVGVASVFMNKELKGSRIAVITHAGGPAVMLTDALSEGGLQVPGISHPKAKELLEHLYPGSSVSNPIDFLATGNAEQLGYIIDYCENYFDDIDGMAVIFGSPGLFPVNDVYTLLDEKMNTCRKPIFPVLPSVINVKSEIEEFLAKGRVNFPDEVVLGRAMARIHNTPCPVETAHGTADIDRAVLRQIVQESDTGYLTPSDTQRMLDAAGISRVQEELAATVEEARSCAERLGFPLVMKVVGPLHKSDVGGVALNIGDLEQLDREFGRLMGIRDTGAVLIQQMLTGTELFAGVKREDKFGHLIMCGMGGIFVEALKDVSTALVPLAEEEALAMIRELKAYRVLEGLRGQQGISIPMYTGILLKMSQLVSVVPEISEMDLNPLLGTPEQVAAVDARIRLG